MKFLLLPLFLFPIRAKGGEFEWDVRLFKRNAAAMELAKQAVAASTSTSTQPASAADPTFKLGKVFVYPDPIIEGTSPAFHIEVGIADFVKILIYDSKTVLLHETVMTASPQVIDGGTGPRFVYEYVWKGPISVGDYLYVVIAEKSGRVLLRTSGKFSVSRGI